MSENDYKSKLWYPHLLLCSQSYGIDARTRDACSGAVDELAYLQAFVDKLPKYADTGEPILRGMEVWQEGGKEVKPWKSIVESIRATSVLFDGMPNLSTHQSRCYSTYEAAEKARDRQ